MKKINSMYFSVISYRFIYEVMQRFFCKVVAVFLVFVFFQTQLVFAMGISVLVEINLEGLSECEPINGIIEEFDISGFVLDPDYEAVRMKNESENLPKWTVIVRGWVDSTDVIKQLKEQTKVVEVWADTKIAPFDGKG